MNHAQRLGEVLIERFKDRGLKLPETKREVVSAIENIEATKAFHVLRMLPACMAFGPTDLHGIVNAIKKQIELAGVQTYHEQGSGI